MRLWLPRPIIKAWNRYRRWTLSDNLNVSKLIPNAFDEFVRSRVQATSLLLLVLFTCILSRFATGQPIWTTPLRPLESSRNSIPLALDSPFAMLCTRTIIWHSSLPQPSFRPITDYLSLFRLPRILIVAKAKQSSNSRQQLKTCRCVYGACTARKGGKSSYGTRTFEKRCWI